MFDYYAGGDIDATMVADADGMIYVSIEHEPSQMKRRRSNGTAKWAN